MSMSVASWRGARWAAPWVFLLFLLFASGLPPARGQFAALRGSERPPEVRVKYRPGQEGIGSAALERWSAQMETAPAARWFDLRTDPEPFLQPSRSVPRIGWHVYRLRSGERADLAAAQIRTLPGVQYAEPVQRVRLLALNPPNDPGYNEYERGEAVFPGGGLRDTDTWRMQWPLHYIQALQGWEVWPGKYFTAADRPRSGPIVAILDTGIDTSHADFANVGDTSTNVKQGGQINGDLSRNLIDGLGNSNPGNIRDDYGHGTHIAGIIGAAANNGRYPGRSDRGYGIVGVGFNAQLAAVKVVDASGYGTDTDVLDAILYAADNGALVINMSLALDGGYSQALQDAVNYAWAKGCVIVAAAGNDGLDSTRRYPAACDKVIAVGATSGQHGIWAEQRAQYSNFGLPLSVAAPGGDLIIDIIEIDLLFQSFPVPLSIFMWVWSTAPTYDTPLAAIPINEREFRYYGYQQGSSMAAPHVSGLAALYAGYRDISPATPAGNLRIQQAIERGAVNLSGVSNGGWQLQYGFGRINVANTMKELNARGTNVGTITGQVYWNSTAMANASITATLLEGGRRHVAGTWIDGFYRLVNLPAGDYEVRATLFGQTKTRRVRVVAGANMPGVTFYMGDVRTDTTPPSKPQLSLARVTGSSPVQLNVLWWSRDTETGVERYEYALGTTPGGNDVRDWTATHLYETTVSFPPNLAAGNYYLSVRGVNGEGLVGEPAVSEAIVIGGGSA